MRMYGRKNHLFYSYIFIPSNSGVTEITELYLRE